MRGRERGRLFFVVLVLALLTACLSNVTQTDPALLGKPFAYVYEVPGTTQAELYKRSLLWVASTYNSAKDVMTFQDEATGTIKGTGHATVQPQGDAFSRSFRYNFAIDARDGKARIVFDSIDTASTKSGMVLKFQIHFDAVKGYMDAMAARFKSSVETRQGSDF